MRKEFECKNCKNRTFIKKQTETTIVKVVDDGGESITDEMTNSPKNKYTFDEPTYECEVCKTVEVDL